MLTNGKVYAEVAGASIREVYQALASRDGQKQI